jgi:hypothetical protein
MSAIQGVIAVDPVLTNFGMEYRQNLPWMSGADLFFPWVRTPGRTGTYYIADPLNSLKDEDIAWSRSAGAKRIDMKFTAAAFRAQKYGPEIAVPDDDVRDWMGGGADLKARAAVTINDKCYLKREVLAEAVLDAISPTSPAVVWNHASTAATPRVDVNTALATIHKRIGRPGNCAGISASVWRSITGSQASNQAGGLIIDAIKYTQAGLGTAVTPSLVAQYFNLDLVVPLTMIKANEDEENTVSTSGLGAAGVDVWDKDEVYVAYVERNPGPQSASYGMSLGPTPMSGATVSIDVYRDDKVNADIVRGAMEFDLKVTCSTSAVAIGDILS